MNKPSAAVRDVSREYRPLRRGGGGEFFSPREDSNSKRPASGVSRSGSAGPLQQQQVMVAKNEI